MLASVALAVYAVALAAAGVSDVVRFRYPNGLSVALVLAFVLFAPALPLAVTAWHLATGLAVLAATAAGFALRLMGGGDAKLIAATALWLGWRNLMPFLVLMVLAGGVSGAGRAGGAPLRARSGGAGSLVQPRAGAGRGRPLWARDRAGRTRTAAALEPGPPAVSRPRPVRFLSGAVKRLGFTAESGKISVTDRGLRLCAFASRA